MLLVLDGLKSAKLPARKMQKNSKLQRNTHLQFSNKLNEKCRKLGFYPISRLKSEFGLLLATSQSHSQ
jgi:hypothetical protein